MTTPPKCRSRVRRFLRSRSKQYNRLMREGRCEEARGLVEHVLFEAALPWHLRRNWPNTGAWVWLWRLANHLGGDYHEAMKAQRGG